MALEWQESSLGDLIEIKHGYAFEGLFIHDEPRGDILLTPGNFAVGGGFKSNKYKYYDGPVSEDFVLSEGDLLLTMTDLSKEGDTLGYPAFVPQSPPGRRYLHNQRLGKVLVKAPEAIDVKFLGYLLRTAEYRHEILAGATGTTVKHTSPQRIKRFTFNRPPLSDQRAIACILSTLDDKIESNRRLSRTLQAMVQTLFVSWFEDFDPVRAKAEGRCSVLTEQFANLFPKSFEMSELGMIPEGWRIASVGDLCRRVAMGPFGSDIKTDNFVEIGVPVVRGSNLTDGFIEDAFVFVSEQKADELRNANAFPGDIVITHRGTLGQVGLIPQDSNFPRYVVSQSQMVICVDQSVSTPRYIFDFLRSSIGQHALLANTSQTGVPAIARPTTSVKAIRLLAPPIQTLMAFEQLVSPIYTRRDRSLEENRTLASLRDTLLPKLISGELRVKAATKIVEAVA